MEKQISKTGITTGVSGVQRQFVRVEEFEWNKFGLKANSRNGFIECKPGFADAIVEAYNKGEIAFEIGQRNRQNGLSDITMIELETGEKTEHTADAAAKAGLLETK